MKAGVEVATTGSAFVRYRALLLPVVRAELAIWTAEAATIPDPDLRAAALQSVTGKSNPEATAVFGILAPRVSRRRVVAASVALQVAIDFLDTLDETEVADPLGAGRRSHRVLAFALTPGGAASDWLDRGGSDGGYLERLGRRCQAAVAGLPGGAALPRARAAAERCGEGQSRTHAAAAGGSADELRLWAESLPGAAGYRWWEVAAGASSSVAAHSLIALAGWEETTAAEAEAVDAAYQPAVGALTVLLDDLLDREADAAAGEHSYLDYCPDPAALAERLDALAGAARAALGGLRLPGRHLAILAGVLAWYLAEPEAERRLGLAGSTRVLAAAGPSAPPLARLLRWQR
jgi:hypothetical protein